MGYGFLILNIFAVHVHGNTVNSKYLKRVLFDFNHPPCYVRYNILNELLTQKWKPKV